MSAASSGNRPEAGVADGHEQIAMGAEFGTQQPPAATAERDKIASTPSLAAAQEANVVDKGWRGACGKLTKDWLGWRPSCCEARVARDVQPVVVKLDYLSYRETKLILLAVYVATLLGALGVLGLLLLKVKGNYDVLKSEWINIFNLTVSSIALAPMLPTAGWLLLSIARTWRQQWDGLRWRMVVSNFLLLIVMITLCALIIAPNAWVLGEACWYLDRLAPIVNDLQSCQYGAWNTVFAILVCQVHELNPVGHQWGAVFRKAKCRMTAMVRSVGKKGGTGAAKGVAKGAAKTPDDARGDVAVGRDSKAGAGSAVANGSGGRDCAARDGDSCFGTAGMDVEQGSATEALHRNSLRHASGPAGHSLWHHLPVLLLWIAVLMLLIFGNLRNDSVNDIWRNTVQYDNDTIAVSHKLAHAEIYVPVWDNISIPLSFFNDYFPNPTPSWELVAANPDVYMPRNVTVYTGDARRDASLHLWGPYDASSDINQWALQDELMVGSASPAVVDMPAGVTESSWALSTLIVWVFEIGPAAPIVDFCLSFAGNDELIQAMLDNQDEFRKRFGLPLCRSTEPMPDNCFTFSCPMPTSELQWAGIVNGLFLLYLILYLYYLSRAYRLLRERPYIAYRLPNVLVRLHTRETITSFLFFFISITALFYVEAGTCHSQIITGLGVSPLAFVGAVLAMVKCVYSCPRLSADEPRLMSHAELQQFAWCEADAPALLAARGRLDAPLFVLETALKALYYSIMAYRLNMVEPDQPFSLRCAMQLDALEQYEIVEDLQEGFKMIAGYRSGKLVLAFRGTVSMQNVRTDALALLKRYDHMQGKYRWMRPYVHRGFLAHWCTVRDQVLALVRRVMQGHCGDRDRPLEVLVTGHSLGGALATLAAYDISCILRNEGGGLAGGTALRCYTFGAPRVGNHAFAALYKAAVCETWDVCNNNDVVPKMTKWMRVYKRSGQRLFINYAGDIICRPSFIELNVNQRTFKHSVADHYLAGYCASFAAVVAAQLSPTKAMEHGRAGVLALAEGSAGQQLLQHLLGMDMNEVQGRLSEAKQGRDCGLLHNAAEALRGMGSTLCAGMVCSVLEEADGPYSAVRAKAHRVLGTAKSQDEDITAGLATSSEWQRSPEGAEQKGATNVNGAASEADGQRAHCMDQG